MRNNLLLLLTAAIWGFAFVAQRKGMESLDPFSFNAIRFALGALVLWLFSRKRKGAQRAFPWSLGLVLFGAASLQQYGMLYTSAGNAGFITGLYVVFVPMLGLLKGQRPEGRTLIAVLLALVGMLLINSVSELHMSLGNLLVLLSAVLWAVHVLMVERLTKVYPTLELAIAQFSVCAVLSAMAAGLEHWLRYDALLLNPRFFTGVHSAMIPLLYGGIMSVGIAYTLQIKAQKLAKASHAAIILCMEGVFALLGGWWLLSEGISLRTFCGAGLMLGAMIIVSTAVSQKSD